MNPQDDSLGFLLADVYRLMRRAFQQRLDGSALTVAQARTLVYVSRYEGVRQVELAELLEIQPITVARLIDQLSQLGLVERRVDAADRRAYRIHLTPQAAPRLADVEAVAAAVRGEALRGLSKEESATVMSALRKIRGNLAPRQ